MNKEEIVNNLNDIIIKNFDASKGFETASKNVSNPALKQALESCAAQRGHFAGILISEVIALEGSPASESSMLGAIHRGWMDIKAALATNEDKAVLNACVTGEHAAVEEYDTLLDKGISGSLLHNVQIQRNEVNDTLHQLALLASKLD